MSGTYEVYTTITKELLDNIGVGDLIKVNDWKKPLKVYAVSENYFVMSTRQFGKCVYSVCEKKPWEGIKYNNMIGGKFHVGRDNWLFGSSVWIENNRDGQYDFNNAEATREYLNTFDLTEHDPRKSSLSHRNAIPIEALYIKRKQ